MWKRGTVRLGLISLLLGGLVHTNGWAQRLQTIDLQQRQAAEVMPLIRPFLRPGDGLSGSGFKLFIRTDPETLAQVRQMLGSLDQPAVSLMISVRRDHQRSGQDRHIGARGAVVIHDGDVGGAAAISAGDRAVQRSGGEMQRVRALAGQPAFIQTGLQVSQPEYQGYIGPRGTRVQRSYRTQDLSSGVYATVQLQAGNRVRIELDSRDSHPQGDRYGRVSAQVQKLSTVISGRLGEWIPIGGSSRSWSTNSRGLLSGGSSTGASDDPVFLRVERLE